MTVLAGMYTPYTGLWQLLWWQSANGIETTIDYSRLAGTNAYAGIITTTFDTDSGGSFVTGSHDDEAWWALAWVKAYDWTGDTKYLAAAETIFTNMSQDWDDVCGGGVWWSAANTYKNAITNELFLTLATRLHERTSVDGGSTPYLTWANQEWSWLNSVGMTDAQGLFNDGLTSSCQNNGGTTWTYNQGVILGGLIELSRITGDTAYLTRAQAIADAATRLLVTPGGILTEACEPDTCAPDGLLFKGIFMRYLAELDAVTSHRYEAFIVKNADSIHEHDTNASGQIGLLWSGPFDTAEPVRQMSGLAALVAAMPYSKKPQ
jgi:predicted alpha-1,6-mannanase (GH76 family)